ncbi:MAG: hypothetical protein KF803_16625 [Cyclobacteriaceae bacterium]|nr:hypothetical protein [Cyclobacteriaceae bacterium]
MFRFLILISVCFLVATTVVAQSSKKKKKNEATNVQQPSSVEPYYPKQNYEPKRKKPAGKVTYDARDRFYDRMEQVAKAHRKAEKELAKPQYSDPTYFGHKKPPKRRPPHKMKYCKECGIRH